MATKEFLHRQRRSEKDSAENDGGNKYFPVRGVTLVIWRQRLSIEELKLSICSNFIASVHHRMTSRHYPSCFHIDADKNVTVATSS